MDRGQLIDLDELVLRCHDEQARQYIIEAVACYKAGAFRASIVATWIAVVFDFIDKLRKLELTGDAKATKKLEEFAEITRHNDITRALNFEKKILDVAKDEFDLLSDLEYQDLSRLLADRNRCAHPSMNSIEEVYQPSAELARYHLRNAVSHMLQRPPVQGKAALDRLLGDINSTYFPTTADAAIKSFESGPLHRPTDALVRNFVIVLAKRLLSGDLDELGERRYYAAVNAVRKMHREVAEKTLSDKLNEIFKIPPDDRVGLVIRFLGFVPDTLQYINNDTRNKIEMYVLNMPADELIPNLSIALRIEDFRSTAVVRLARVKPPQLAGLINSDAKSQLSEHFTEPAVTLFENAQNYSAANYIYRSLLEPLVNAFNDDQIDRLIQAGHRNEQVKGSFGYGDLLTKIVENGRLNEFDMRERLTEIGLGEFVDRLFPEPEE